MRTSGSCISLFIPSLAGGGAERVTVLLANGLVDRGYRVDLVVCQDGGAYANDIDVRVNLISLGTTRVGTAIFPLIRYLNRAKPHSLISAMSHTNVVAIIAKILCKSPINLLVVEHNTFSKDAISFKSRLLRPLIKFLYPHADWVAGVSRGVAKDFSETLKINVDKIHVLYNPVVSIRLKHLMLEAPTHPWFQDKGDPIFVGIGRLTKQKNFELLIDAFAIVNQSQRSRLVIFGEGELRPQLEKQISRLSLDDRISLPGFCSNPFSHIRSSAAFVLSSSWEGLPTVLIEALACGAQVISTDCPSGPNEILGAGRWGQLVSVGNSKELAAAMIQTLVVGKPELGVVRSEDFSIDKAVDGYLRLLGLDTHVR